jgi:hypothetical protein
MLDKATGRVVAVVVLLIVIAAALRGYLPGDERATRQEPPDSGASLVYVVALLGMSLTIVAVALITRLRDPRGAAAGAGGLPERFSGGRGRPARRVLVIGAAVLVAWLLLIWLLSRFVVLRPVGEAANSPPSSAPTPANNAARPPAPPHLGGEAEVLRYLIAGTVGLVVLIVVGAVLTARRRRSSQPGTVAAQPSGALKPPATSESLVRAAEIGLAEVGDLSQEPREAIIACYAAMERELIRVPGAMPQDFDTPTEVLARAVELHALHVDNASQLVSLFEEARFSPHVMNEGHRESALRVLQLVLAELRSAV